MVVLFVDLELYTKSVQNILCEFFSSKCYLLTNSIVSVGFTLKQESFLGETTQVLFYSF